MQQPRSNFTTFLRAFTFTLLAGGLFACGGGSSSSPNNGGSNPNPDPAPVNVELDFHVQTYDGARLSDATLTLNETTAQSDEDGYAQFIVPSQDTYVVRAEADGFVTQALKVDASEDGVMPIKLMPVGQTLSLNDIEAARTLSGESLGVRITFPANTFVNADGEPATGSATVEITPWDIANGDLNAMPGNGQAVDAMGDPTVLISAGLMSVNVRDENGDYLQVAPGTLVEIQMDLPQASINNEALSVGSTIPMWHFDEEQGVWVEDDSTIGIVVESATSPVGLAVRAQVSHFSIWNWDFKFENSGSINVECRLSDDTAVPCGISAEVVLDDGSIFTRNGQLPEGGSTIINMPLSATINWHAVAPGGFIGTQTTDMSADVVIELGEPSSKNVVRCLLPDDSAVACSVTLTDGTDTLTQSVPAAGATVVTGFSSLDENSVLNWVAETPFPITYNGQQVLAEGTFDSGVTDDVTIELNTMPIDQVNVQCLSGNGTPIPCTVDVVATLADGTQFTDTGILVNQNIGIAIPSESILVQWSATSNGAFSQEGQFVELSGSLETGLVSNVAIILDDETVQGPAAQSIEIDCINSAGTSATSCDIEVHLEGQTFGYILLDSFDAVPVGDSITLEFPDGISGQNEWVQITASGDDESYASYFSTYGAVSDGQSVELELACNDAAGGTTCL